jgi:hypothetical protein
VTTTSGGTLASVQLNGDLVMNTTSANVLITGSTRFAAARLQANNATLYIPAGYTLSDLVQAEGAGVGTRVLALASGVSGTVTFGASAVVRLAAGAGAGLSIADSSVATLINNGLITAEAPGQTLTIGITHLTNNGTIQALAGSSVSLADTFTNTGLLIGVTGQLNITGTLNNVGATQTLNATTGSWRLVTGTISGGTINQLDGQVLTTTTSGGTLASVQLNGDLVMNTTSANVLITGSTRFAAARLQANNATLYIPAGYTLSDLVQAEGAGVGTRVLALASGVSGTVTFGASAVVRLAAGAGAGLSIADSSVATLINNGLITAEAPGQTLTIGITHLTNNGTIQAALGGSLVIVGQAAGAGNYLVNDNSTLTSDGLIGNSLSVSGAATIRSNGAASGTSKLNSLTIANAAGVYTGKLDLTNNPLILQSADPGDKTGKLTALSAAIIAGPNGAKWNGHGITSSAAAADPNHYAVGLFDNALLALASYHGQTLDPSSILLSIAHLGDANLNAIVDIQDQSLITNNWQTPKNNWAAGDLNLDGFVDIQDLTLVTNNWQQQSAFSLSSSVPQSLSSFPTPEPLTLPLLAFPCLLLKRRRAHTPALIRPFLPRKPST